MKTKTKFKQTEIGMIPEYWEVDKLENHLIIKGRIGWKGLQISEYTDVGPFIVGGLQIKENNVVWEECAHVTEGRYKESPEIMLRESDILMTKDGTIGKLAYIKSLPNKATVASHIHVIRKNSDKILPQFLFYFFKSPIFQNLVESKISGSVVPALTQKDINSTEFPLPPIPEQQHIAKILSDLDSKIELNHQMNKILEETGKTIFRHWFIDFEFLNEECRPYKSSGGNMVYNEELGRKIPKEWEVKIIKDVVTVKGGSTPSTKNAEYWDGKINWCTPKDLSALNSLILLDTERKITESGLSTISSDLLPVGTVLLSSRAPIGYLAISEIPVAVNQGFIAIVCDKILSKYFMLFWLQHNMDIIESRAHGTTFQEINKTSFKKINILAPSPEILNNFDKLVQPLYRKVVKNQKEITILSHLRDSLLPKLMSGKIRVPVEAR
jgi:type I restriction enzyme S subunit